MVAAMEVIELSDDDDSTQENSKSSSQHNGFRGPPNNNNNASKPAPINNHNGFRSNVTSSRIQVSGGGTGTVTITEKPLDLTALFAGNSTPPPAITPPTPLASALATPPVSNGAGVNGRFGHLLANGSSSARLSLPAKPITSYGLSGNLTQSKKFSDNTVDLSQIGEVSRKRLFQQKSVGLTNFIPYAVPEKKSRSSNVQAIKAIHGYTTFQVSEPSLGSVVSDNDEFTGQFRCTALNCNKVLPNNVSFMFHMWAHVVFFTRREYTTDANAMSDEKFHRMCPCCWNVFENAYDRTQHYLYVHRNVFASHQLCHICEIVDFDQQHREKVQHKSSELPFECRKCKFRTSSRMGLIQHFFKIHICTTLVICPFCPFYVHVSPGERNRGMAMAKTFVAHIMEHSNFSVVHRKCSSCSYKFTSASLFEKHVTCHQTETHKYPITSKSFKTLKDEMASPRPRMDALTLLKCVECDSLFPKAESHFGKKHKCKRCDYTSNCEQAYNNHVHNSPCDPFYNRRDGLTNKLLNNEKGLKPVPVPEGYTPSVCKSPDFAQNFGPFRDFEYDRKPARSPPPKPETDSEKRLKLRERLIELTLPRKVKSLDEVTADSLAKYLFEYEDKRPDTVTFVKNLRRPLTRIFSAACEHVRQLQESN